MPARLMLDARACASCSYMSTCSFANLRSAFEVSSPASAGTRERRTACACKLELACAWSIWRSALPAGDESCRVPRYPILIGPFMLLPTLRDHFRTIAAFRVASVSGVLQLSFPVQAALAQTREAQLSTTSMLVRRGGLGNLQK